MKDNVVVLGGGNGSALTLRALKRKKELFNISGVITMSDSGGSSGRLRDEFETLAPGDIMRAITALSPHGYRTELRPMFYKERFKGCGKLDGHNLGNLFLILASQYAGDFMSAVRALEQAVDAQGTIYPATLERHDLVAELDNGDIIRTEAVIDEPEYDRDIKIKKVWLEPEPQAHEEALQAIRDAHFILLGPGSLYTSVVASILPKGVSEAIAESKGRLIYIVGNKYEKFGETGPTQLHDFVNVIELYLPRPIDAVVFNNTNLSGQQRAYYEMKNWGVIEFIPEKLRNRIIVAEPFERQSGGLSAEKLSRLLVELMS